MDEGRKTVGGTKVYNVNTEVFKGPFDVLLDLIEKRKLFINDISLAQVADDFIGYIRDQDRFPLQESAHFILIASTLILIKSRSLLPSLTLTEEEEDDIEELERRLKLYKEVKEHSEALRESWGGRKLFFGRGESFPYPISFVPDLSVSQDSLVASAEYILNRVPKESDMPQVKVGGTVKLKTVINSLISRISVELSMSFREFSGLDDSGLVKSKKGKHMVIVSFIALLELVKQGLLTAHQDEGCFNDIYIESSDPELSGYV